MRLRGGCAEGSEDAEGSEGLRGGGQPGGAGREAGANRKTGRANGGNCSPISATRAGARAAPSVAAGLLSLLSPQRCRAQIRALSSLSSSSSPALRAAWLQPLPSPRQLPAGPMWRVCPLALSEERGRCGRHFVACEGARWEQGGGGGGGGWRWGALAVWRCPCECPWNMAKVAACILPQVQLSKSLRSVLHPQFPFQFLVALTS